MIYMLHKNLPSPRPSTTNTHPPLSAKVEVNIFKVQDQKYLNCIFLIDVQMRNKQ